MIDPVKIKKEEIHKKIDDTFNLIIKSMGNIFDKIKFNEAHSVEETNNLEISTSIESTAIRLQDLVKIVNDMKVEYLKKSEFNKDIRKQYLNKMKNTVQEVDQKMLQLQENYNFVNNILKDNKSSKYYKFSLNYNLN